MKTFITNIFKFVVVATMFLSGAAFASAAGQFENEFPGSGTGFLSVFSADATNSCPGCANQNNSISISAPNPGDTDRFSAFIYYRNNGDANITNARGRITVSGSTVTGRLTGGNASNTGTTDTGFLQNLPQDYDINFVSARVENTQGSDDPQYCSGYNLDINVNESTLSGSGAPIGTLDTVYSGICDQGYVVAVYEVVNTESIIIGTLPPEIDTNPADFIDENSATLFGDVEEGSDVNVWFRYSTSSNVSCSNGTFVNGPNSLDAGDDFDRTITGLNDDTTYYFIACGEDNNGIDAEGVIRQFTTDDGNTGGGSLSVDTEPASGIDDDQATLNGEIQSGSTNYSFFVWSTDDNLQCGSTQNGGQNQVAVDWTDTRTAGDNFEFTLGGLFEDTTYYYRACASANGVTAQGVERSFTTDGNTTGGSNDSEPVAETEDEDDVDEDSAELNGRVRMNDFNDGTVFYVFGTDENRIDDVDNDYEEYGDIDEDDEEIRKVKVDEGNDEDSWEYYPERVNGLDEDETYYYRICVEFENTNGDDEIKCGDIEDFETDDDNTNSNNDDVEIQTISARNITPTSAQMCGEVTDDGGSPVVTWIEFRRSTESGFNSKTPNRQRGEVAFCETVGNLQPGTSYRFRACTEDSCGGERSFTTPTTVAPQGTRPFIFTEPVTAIRSNSATLNSNYVANAPTATCRFNYGRTQSLGRQTRSYAVNGIGQCPHNFTNLASGTQYCVQAVIETQFGTDQGAIRCFNTPAVVTTGGPTPVPTPPQVVVVEDEDEPLNLGFGLSLVRLEIDDEEEVSIQGQNVEYVIEWENISELDLEDLDLRVEIPQEVQITDVTRGRFDQNTNTIFFTIDELDGADFENDRDGESGRMSVFGTIGRGTEGNLLTAEAELAYDNPINDAQENARDFDVNSYAGSQLTASVFGLANITFLGWLVILLGLFIIFLVARWLYLEREELRAQAYLTGGYGSNYNQQPRMPIYRDPSAQYNVPPAAPQMPPAQYNNAPQMQQQDDYYEPYRPNRG